MVRVTALFVLCWVIKQQSCNSRNFCNKHDAMTDTSSLTDAAKALNETLREMCFQVQ